MIVILFVLLISITFNFYRNGELPSNQVSRSGAQIEETERKIRRHVFTFSTKPCQSTAEHGKEMYRNLNNTCKTVIFAH